MVSSSPRLFLRRAADSLLESGWFEKRKSGGASKGWMVSTREAQSWLVSRPAKVCVVCVLNRVALDGNGVRLLALLSFVAGCK